MSEEFKRAALDYHEFPVPGKLSVTPTKPCATQSELALAYSPGVAEPVRAIVKNEQDVYRFTNKGNLVAVVSDGTAVLGLGNTGALAAKPVLEGKGVLFKHFADVDVFDIEIKANSKEDFIQTVINISPTFGGINLEDITAPVCFEIEEALDNALDIPVFHDDQHGTAVIVCAGLLNALKLQAKSLETAKIVCLGAGAAGISSMKLLLDLGANPHNLVMVDRKGVIRSDRDDLNEYKRAFATDLDLHSLADALNGADVFIGVSGGDLMTQEMLLSMTDRPIVFALANPDPEIKPELAHSVRDDLIMATGRSDYPNQVNNVLGFPFIFRGALDVHASCINKDMLCAAVRAIRDLAHVPVPREVLDAYKLDHLEFGPDYIIPTPLDPRLIKYIPAAVARAAVDSGVARKAYPTHYGH